MEKDIRNILSQFQIKGEVLSFDRYGNGHINSTFLIKTTEDVYILQKINNYVFPNVDGLMSNIFLVTSYLHEKGKETLRLIKTLEGNFFLKYGDEYYRIFIFVKDTICVETAANNLFIVSELGKAFGELHHLLNDFDATKLFEVIPDFHNTKKRYQNFLDALDKADETKKNKCINEINYIKGHSKYYSLIVDGIKEGKIKNNITHNDTKINNVLFDKTTNKSRCVIDLDTIMPGSILYDIGDGFRSLFTGDNEDSYDLSKLKVNLPIFETYMSSYLKLMKNDLTSTEISLIPYSIFILTIECGMRFLEDYLRGNVYFHVQYEEHNLTRCKTQIALAEDVLTNIDKLKDIVKSILKRV